MKYRLLNGWTYDSVTGKCITERGFACTAKPRPDGYIQICLPGGWRVYLHRLIWVSVYGKIKKGFVIDHKNSSRSDNRLKNLRLVPASLNAQKRLPQISSNHMPGVAERKTGKFRARIVVNHERISLGDFDSEEEAYNEYLKAKKKWHLAGAAETIRDNV